MQRLEHMSRHRQVHVPGFWGPMNRAAHAPCPVRRVLWRPAISFAELLCSKLRDHLLDQRLVSWFSSFDYCADGEGGGVVGVVRGVVHQAKSTVGISVGLDEFECPSDRPGLR